MKRHEVCRSNVRLVQRERDGRLAKPAALVAKRAIGARADRLPTPLRYRFYER